MDRKMVLDWFQDQMRSSSTKIFHNAMYDVCWLRALGIQVNGMIVDTMIAASLIDENRLFYVGATRTKNHLHVIRPKDIYKGYKI